MKIKEVPLVLILLILYCLACDAQNLSDTTRIFRIETTDGNIYTGSIISEDQDMILLRTERLGDLKIPLSDIKSRTSLKGVKEIAGRIWLPNPQSSRYFWSPNGYGLEEGNSYYQNIWVLYNQFSFGISNNISFGLGTIPLFLFAGTPTPFWIVPKVSIPVVSDKVNIGTGAFLGTILGEGMGFFGLLYETTTIGSRDKNVSLGFAYGFADGKWMNRPIINLSAMLRTGPKGYFITENYIIPYETTSFTDYYNPTTRNNAAVILSLGGRSIIRNVGLDYSLWIPINAEMDTFLAIPFLGVTVPLGNKKPVK